MPRGVLIIPPLLVAHASPPFQCSRGHGYTHPSPPRSGLLGHRHDRCPALCPRALYTVRQGCLLFPFHHPGLELWSYVSCLLKPLPPHPSQRLAKPFPISRSLSLVATVTPSNIVTIFTFFSPALLLPPSPDYVGYWPSSNSVVVAHQGTDPIQL